MIGWAKENNITINDKLDYHHQFSYGRGCIAKQKVEEGEEILRIPLEHCIGHEAHFGTSPFSQFSAVIQTTLCLLKEQLKGKESKFDAYLQTLKDERPHNLIMFSDEERGTLRGTSLDWATETTDPEVNYREKFLPFIEESKENFPTRITYSQFRRAMSLVLSRGFHLNDKGPFLVPFADSLNHHCEHPHTGLEGMFDSGEVGFIMRAGKAMFPDEEVFNTYGDLASHQLLQTFGFIPRHNNPHEIFACSQAIIKSAMEEHCPEHPYDPKKVAAMKKAGIPFPPSVSEEDVSELVTVCFWLGPHAINEEVVANVTLEMNDGEPYCEALRMALGVVSASIDTMSEVPTNVMRPSIQQLHKKERALLHITRRTIIKELTMTLMIDGNEGKNNKRRGSDGSGNGGKRGKRRRR